MNKNVIGTIAILFGGVGVHKLMLGQIGKAFLFFIFSWTMIPLILGIIEGISLITMSEERFKQKYEPQSSPQVIVHNHVGTNAPDPVKEDAKP